MQRSQVHGPGLRSVAFGLGLGSWPNPKVPDGFVAEFEGRGASQIVHFSFAESGFLSMQVSHVQSAAVGVFDVAVSVTLAMGLGDSQIVHFSLAESGFFSMHVSHVQSATGAGVIAGAGKADELVTVRPNV